MKNTLTLFLTFVFTCLICKSSLAAIGYSFVASNGSYTANSAPTTIHAANADDAISAAINIGFTFNYGGCTSTPYTQLRVSTNGWLTFGYTGTSNSASNDLNLTTLGKVVAPLWDDLRVGSAGTVNYQLSGSAPNRVFTIEWKQMRWTWSVTNPVISFQVKLYETSNKIEFIYNQEATAVSSGSASIGMNGAASGDYYSLNNTGASPTANYGSQTSTLNTKPATGQIYTWNAPSTMSYVSSNVTQASTNDVYLGTTNQELIRLEIIVNGGCSPFPLTQLIMNMTGTTTISDVVNIDIYYTGNVAIYSVATLFGSGAPAAGNITINGSQTLVEGSNYFWISYDISGTATLSNFVDAGCTQITVNGNNITPTGNPPAGQRQIIDAPPSFSKWIEYGWARSIIVESNDDLVWAGGTTNAAYTSGQSDIHIVKTDKDANTIYWSTVIGGATGQERANDIVKTADGYIVVGYTTGLGLTTWDMIISKIDLNGTHLWTKVIGPTTSTTSEGYSIIKTSDGNVAICGTIKLSSEQKGYFAKINQSNGSIIAEKYFDGTSIYLYDLKQTLDGGYIVVGTDRVSGDNEFFMAKLASDLSITFGYRWGTISTDKLVGVIENSANNYTVFGQSFGLGAGSSDGYAMRFTASGSTITPVYTKAYGTIDYNTFSDVTLTTDGNYAISGLTTRVGGTNEELWFVKLDASTGNYIAHKSIGTTLGTEDQEGYGIASLAEGSFVMAGLHNNASGPNFYMAKISGTNFSCAEKQDVGSITNLTTPSFTADNILSVQTPTYTIPTVTVGSGAAIITSCQTISAPINLPIELITFYGEGFQKHNRLYWTTSSERENDYFTVEKSQNGLDWEILGKVKGAGNSVAELNYTLNDNHPFSPITYYKLKQTDFNGSFKYSDIIAITRAKTGDLFSVIYPNPTTDKFSFVYSGKMDDYELKIYNALGELIEQRTFDGEKNIEEISISSYSQGIYFVHFIQNQHTSIQKIIKN